MKRPDLKQLGIMSALAVLVALSVTGCGGVNATVPISPMMFLQNPAPFPAPAGPFVPTLAVNGVPAEGQ